MALGHEKGVFGDVDRNSIYIHSLSWVIKVYAQGNFSLYPSALLSGCFHLSTAVLIDPLPGSV